MPAKTKRTASEIYQIKVTLLATRPLIWRRLLVPASLSLEQLHHVLQLTMGWENCHLHDFRIGGERYAAADPEEDADDERRVRLSEVLGRAGARAVYTYDFGDSWEHNIVVEKVLPPKPDVVYPVCVAGKRRGPPEDCGGVGGFERLLETMSDPNDTEHDEMLEWLGGEFDPGAFSVEEINQRLSRLRPRKRAGA